MQKPGHLTFATKPLISNFMRNKKKHALFISAHFNRHCRSKLFVTIIFLGNGKNF